MKVSKYLVKQLAGECKLVDNLYQDCVDVNLTSDAARIAAGHVLAAPLGFVPTCRYQALPFSPRLVQISDQRRTLRVFILVALNE